MQIHHQGENWLCSVGWTFGSFFGKILQYIKVISSHILVLYTCLPTQGSAQYMWHLYWGGASSHPKSTTHFLQSLSVIAIFWCYCFIPNNEFHGAEEKRKENMSSEIIGTYPKVWPTFSAHEEQEYYASILNTVFDIFCKSIHDLECLL